MCALSWSNFATSCSRPMKLLHYVSQAPHTNICNSIMHKDLQNAAISLNESNSWRRLTTKDQKWLQTWFQTPLCACTPAFDRNGRFAHEKELQRVNCDVGKLKKRIAHINCLCICVILCSNQSPLACSLLMHVTQYSRRHTMSILHSSARHLLYPEPLRLQ